MEIGDFLKRVQPGAWSTIGSQVPPEKLLNTELENQVIFCHITFALIPKFLKKKLQHQKHFCWFYITAMWDSSWDFTENEDYPNAVSSYPSIEVVPGMVKRTLQ